MHPVAATLQTSTVAADPQSPHPFHRERLGLFLLTLCLLPLIAGCNSFLETESSIAGTLTLTSAQILPGFRSGEAELRPSVDQTTVTLIQGVNRAQYTKGIDPRTGVSIDWEITEGEVQTTQTTSSRTCRLSGPGCQSPSKNPSPLVPPETCLGTQWVTQEQDWVEVNARVTWTLPGDHAEFTGSTRVRLAERVITLTPCQSLGGP